MKNQEIHIKTLTASGAEIPIVGTNHYAVTPSDTITFNPSNIYVGTGGDLALKLLNNDTVLVYKNIPNGTFLPLLVTAVYVTGTVTATDIIRIF